MNLFNTNKINRVFPINLEQTDKVKGGGYLVEISQTTPGVFSYFLVTPNVQKELVNASSSYYENVNTPCSITKYLTTGNERGLQRKLQDKVHCREGLPRHHPGDIAPTSGGKLAAPGCPRSYLPVVMLLVCGPRRSRRIWTSFTLRRPRSSTRSRCSHRTCVSTCPVIPADPRGEHSG